MRHPAGGPMARGRLAKIGMLRRLMRVKSTLPRRPSPLAAPCLTAPRLAAPFPSPRRPARRAAPLTTVALLHVLLVGMALLHAQGPRSAQERRSNGASVQERRTPVLCASK